MAVSNPAKMSEIIRQELIRLRILPNILGHYYLVYMIEQVVLDPLQIRGVTKGLYPETAKVFYTNWRAVEHDARVALEACWNRGGRETLDKMARYHLTKRPSVKEFISIVAAYINITYRR